MSYTQELTNQPKTGGYSLIELTIVICLLGIAASAAVPVFLQQDEKKLDLASAEITHVLRYARSEAMSKNKCVGVEFDTAQAQINVYSLSSCIINTSGVTKVQDITQPIDKKTYPYTLNDVPLTADVAINTASFAPSSGTADNKLLFDNNGNAQIFTLTSSTLSFGPLITGALDLSYLGKTRRIIVSGIGRIS